MRYMLLTFVNAQYSPLGYKVRTKAKERRNKQAVGLYCQVIKAKGEVEWIPLKHC